MKSYAELAGDAQDIADYQARCRLQATQGADKFQIIKQPSGSFDVYFDNLLQVSVLSFSKAADWIVKELTPKPQPKQVWP